MEVNRGNESDIMEKIEKTSYSKVKNLLRCKFTKTETF